MRPVARITAGLVLMALALCLSGCAGPKGEQPADDEKVSTLPWNRPEKWEKGVPGGGASY